MNYEIELRLPALTGCLHVVDACVRRLCRTALGEEDHVFQEAVHAACVYSIEHAYGGDDVDHRLELSFAVGRKELSVTLIDTGAATNALQDHALVAVAASLDEAVYERLDATNTLRLVRRSAK
jgi:hypothetical protein